jgi:DNA repair protein RadC
MSVAAYAVSDHSLVLDVSPRSYVLKVRDMPEHEKPREKMLALGAATLSTTELLAVILNTGTRKEDVLSMCRRVLHEYGERSLMHHTNPAALAENLDIPIGKALQIVAVAELGRRFFHKNSAGAATIRTAKDVFEHTKDMQHLQKEHLRGIYLNANHKVVYEEVISIGTVNANLVHPREVFKPALEYAAVAVILVHNHPSGSVTPSAADIEVTRQLIAGGKLLGIDLLDHVIVTKTQYFSIPVEYS